MKETDCGGCAIQSCQDCCAHEDAEFGFCIYCGANLRELTGANHADSTRGGA